MNSKFTLWQIPSQIGSIGMSYVLRTGSGRIIVFDGGWAEEAGYMRGFLGAFGNRVDAWFLSHPHDDHAGVLLEVLKDPRDIAIDTLYQSSLDPEWYAVYEPDFADFSRSYYAAVEQSGVKSIEAQIGMTIEIDGVLFEILSIKNPEFEENPYNNQSVVVKVTDSEKSVLFLGDLGEEAGRKLLAGPMAGKVRSDYVQMAHHGQNGVDEDFYRAVDPSYCLWPTPEWVYENATEAGPNTGILTTMQTRDWVKRLNIKQHYLSFEGLVKID